MEMKPGMNLKAYKGRTGFGTYDELLSLENDLHAPGTVDSVLLDEMVKLLPETEGWLYSDCAPLRATYKKGGRPYLEGIVGRVARQSGDELRAKSLARWCSGIQSQFPTPEKSTEKGFWTTDTMLFGGTEEELIKRGTYVCTELSRVLCALAQVAGMPSRLVYLFDMTRKNWGHGVVEIYIRSGGVGSWAVFDATSDACYAKPEGGLASAWDLRCRPELADAHPDHGNKPYVSGEFYRCSAIANYFVSDWSKYDYGWNLINDYYMRIWEGED
ncbi:MAG: transglutaminase domain-containing protein [Methanobacteriota archaeon]